MDTVIDEIFTLLAYISSANGVIKLMSTNRGIAIGLEAMITNIDRENSRIEILAREQREVPFSPSDQIILTSVLFPKPVCARVEEIWRQTQALTLSEFTYGSTSMGNRSKERVEPERSLKVNLAKQDGSRYSAEIIDLSIEGISISFAKNTLPSIEIFEQGEEINLQFTLPPRERTPERKLSISARLVYISPAKENQPSRAGLRIFPNQQQTEALRKYIFDRQTAIYHLLQSET